MRHSKRQEVSQSRWSIIFKGNEESMAIELIMVRYCWAFAYYHEADTLITKIRDKITTTFKQNSATLEDYQY